MHVEGHERERGVRRGDIGIFPYLPGDIFILGQVPLFCRNCWLSRLIEERDMDQMALRNCTIAL